ncbi:MAG: O-antigen ligase family protein [Planctomycetota bacterium]
MLSLRFAVLLVLVPILIALSLRRPLWGVFSLLLMYYFRPDVWGKPVWWRPVEWLTIATLLSWLIRAKDIRFERGLGLSLIFLGTMLVSTMSAARSSEVSLDATETILKLVVMQFICVQVIRDLNTVMTFLWVNVLANLWTLKSALVQTIFGSGVRVDVGAAQGGGANYLAMTFVMTLPLLYFRFLKGTPRERKLAMAIIPLEIIGCVGTGSRGGFLTLFFVFGFLAVRSGQKLKGFMLALAFGLVFLIAVPDAQWNRFVNTFKGDGKESASQNSRLGLWKVGLQLFKESPIVGVGHDNYQLLSPRYYGFFAGQNPIPYDPALEGQKGYTGFVAHSTWVQSLADGGILGSIPFFALFAWAMWTLYRVRRARIPPGELESVREISQIIEGTMWAFIIASSFASHMKLDFLWYYFGAIGAFGIIVRRREAQVRRETREAYEATARSRAVPVGS